MILIAPTLKPTLSRTPSTNTITQSRALGQHPSSRISGPSSRQNEDMHIADHTDPVHMTAQEVLSAPGDNSPIDPASPILGTIISPHEVNSSESHPGSRCRPHESLLRMKRMYMTLRILLLTLTKSSRLRRSHKIGRLGSTMLKSIGRVLLLNVDKIRCLIRERLTSLVITSQRQYRRHVRSRQAHQQQVRYMSLRTQAFVRLTQLSPSNQQKPHVSAQGET